jgi:transcriptional regulator with XRE-family HTH domain
MIKNERQLVIANRKLRELEAAAGQVDPDDAIAYHDLAEDLRHEIAQYINARDGRANLFSIGSVDGLGRAAIQARIARGWSQKQLAEELGVSEQMVQKDESREYENVGLAKLAEILDVLGYELAGSVRPKHLRPEEWRVVSGVAGLTSTAYTPVDEIKSRSNSQMYGGVIGVAAHRRLVMHGAQVQDGVELLVESPSHGQEFENYSAGSSAFRGEVSP